jgi:hypothetical protein
LIANTWLPTGTGLDELMPAAKPLESNVLLDSVVEPEPKLLAKAGARAGI